MSGVHGDIERMSDRLAHADSALRAGRRDEAIALLVDELAAAPSHGAHVYRVLVRELLNAGRFAEAETWAARGLAAYPADAEGHRLHGRTLQRQLKRQAAAAALRRATELAPQNVDAWLDLVGVLINAAGPRGADAAFDLALTHHPDEPRLSRLRGETLRQAGDVEGAQAFLTGVLARAPETGWALFQLANVTRDAHRSVALLRRAVAVEPEAVDFHIALSARLQASRGASEGGDLEEAYQLVCDAVTSGATLGAGQLQVVVEALQRVCAFDELEGVAPFVDVGRSWARAGLPAALLRQLPRVRSDADRRELLSQHRLWGESAEAAAAGRPLAPAADPVAGGKIRLGFLSNGLRGHVVAFFALPLFEHLDRARFEVFCYATHTEPLHPIQSRIEGLVTAYRVMPQAPAHEVAQAIADDGLDMLVEIGGPTDGNPLSALAWRPAPIQASWMGYPHSVGLSAIDGLICDPHGCPPDSSLLLEAPLRLPRTWVVLGEAAFPASEPIGSGIASDRNGYVTYGTANNPYKFNRPSLRAWARIVARTPGSRFAIVRPEAGSPTFRRNVAAEFAAEGVSEDRLDFHAVRGSHLPLYDEIDVTLDAFPLTGGTTTAEALWMGVPVVTLVGEAMYERLSYSLLANVGLEDLAAADLAQYEAIALALAADAPRRRALKQDLRSRIYDGPLGDTAGFARDFYDLVARTVGA